MRGFTLYLCIVLLYTTLALAQETPKPQAVKILSKPNGAELVIDGKLVGKTPVETNLLPGDHKLTLTLKNYQTLEEVISITDSPALFSLQLSPQPSDATLKIFTNNDPAEILLDGNPVGKSPVSVDKVAPGPHILTAIHPDFARVSKAIEAKPNEVMVFKLEMTALPPTAARLRVISSVMDAEVFLDGQREGKSPIDRNDLLPGVHIVTIRKDGYTEWTRQITLEAGKGLELIAELESSAKLRLEGAPRGASLYLDQTLSGTMPEDGTAGKIGNVSSGKHILSVKHPNYLTWERNFSANPGETLVIFFDGREKPKGISLDPKLSLRQSTQDNAYTLPAGSYLLHASLGYPYLLGSYGVRVGVLDKLDLGANFRSFGSLSEIIASGRYLLNAKKRSALATEGSIGLGFGTQGTSSFMLEGSAIATGMLSQTLGGSAKLTMGLYGDGSNRDDFLKRNGSDSQFAARLLVGFRAFYLLSDSLALEASLDAAPAQSPRHLYEIGPLSESDTTVYFHLGVSHKK